MLSKEYTQVFIVIEIVIVVGAVVEVTELVGVVAAVATTWR